MKIEDKKKSDKLVDLWWFKIPVASQKISNMLSGIFTDGLFMTAWPKIAKIAPPSMFAIGLLLGGLHLLVDETAEIFTSSIPLMALMLILSSFSAALGTWLWAGYVIGDFFLYPLITVNTLSGNELLDNRAALIVAYLLLGLLLILIPYVASALRRQTLGRIDKKKYHKKGIVLNVVLQAAIQGALVYVWTQAVPTLIRPVYTWQGIYAVPPSYAIQPLQQEWLSLVLLAIFLGAIRMAPEYLALKSSTFPQHARRLQAALDPLILERRRRRRRLLPIWVSIPFKAAFFTLILSGIISTWVEALFLAAILAFIMVEREMILPKFKRWTRWISRVPIIIRLAICAAITYYIGSQILVAVWNNQFAPPSSPCIALGFIPCEMILSSSNTFLPIVFSLIFSLIISSIILPRQPERSEVRSNQRNQ